MSPRPLEPDMNEQRPDTILLAIGRLEGKMDSLIAMQRQFETKLDTHDKRLRDLENHKAYALGVAAAVGSAISVIVSYLMRKV
jgi:hypothetical protein